MLTVAAAATAWLQVPLLTLVKFKVVLVVTPVIVTVAVPPPPMVAVPEDAPVYVTVFPAVPVIVNTALLPEQTGLLEDKVAAKAAGVPTIAVAVVVHPFASVTVTLYVPAAMLDRSWDVAVNEFGPVHSYE